MLPPDDLNEDGQPDASGLTPHLLSGNRRVSLAALRERVELQFNAETAMRPDFWRDDDETARRDLIRELVEYVLTVEGITLSREERLAVQDLLYRDLFFLGPLFQYLQDQSITEIKIDGPDKVYIRHGSGDFLPAEAHFDDQVHLERIIERTLASAGVELSPQEPLLETGVRLAGRQARLTVALPPVSPTMHASLRLHPAEPLTIADLIVADRVDENAADLLLAILKAGHGLTLVGEAGAGKTSLIQALLPYVSTYSVAVERAAELVLPGHISGLSVIPPGSEREPVDFTRQIEAAIGMIQEKSWLILDEVRFDESAAIWDILNAPVAARCLWALRGGTDPFRLRTAFSMSVRRAQQGIDQALIYNALVERIPFAALLARREGKLKLVGISEWQRTGPDDIALKPIWPPVGNEPAHRIEWVPV